MTKSFLLRANAVYEYKQSDDPYGDKPVDPPFVPYYPPSPPGPEYGIRLDVPVRAADASYGTGAPVEVTLTNTGDRPTGALAILPSGPNSADFTLSPDSLDSIGAGGDTAFTLTVTPTEWLAAGDYALTVIVSGDHGITASFDLAITVVPIEPGPPAVIVEKQGGGCRGQAALGSLMGPAMLAPAVFSRRSIRGCRFRKERIK